MPSLPCCLRQSQELSRLGFQRWGIPQGPREQGQSRCESHDGSGCHGGHDGDDERKHDDDDSADGDYGVDQRVFRWLCHQYVLPLELELEGVARRVLWVEVLTGFASETSVPSYSTLQIYAPIWSQHSRSRCPMGVISFVVLPQPLRLAICVYFHPWKRQR